MELPEYEGVQFRELMLFDIRCLLVLDCLRNPHRIIFNSVLKVIQDCFGFNLLHYAL